MDEPIRGNCILVVAVVPMAMRNLWVADESGGNSKGLDRPQKVTRPIKLWKNDMRSKPWE